MELIEFVKRLREYEDRAKKRLDERRSSGLIDGTWRDHVLEELIIDLIDRTEKLEEILKG